MKCLQKNYRQFGFTLVELMVVVFIIAAIAVFGVPSFGNYIANRKVNAAATQIASSLQMARSQAVTLGRNVGICGTNQTATSCANGSNWSDGWIVYISSEGGAGVAKVLQAYYVADVNIAATQLIVNPSGMATGAANIVVTPKNEGTGISKTLNVANITMELTVTTTP